MNRVRQMVRKLREATRITFGRLDNIGKSDNPEYGLSSCPPRPGTRLEKYSKFGSLAHRALIPALRNARKEAGLSQQEVAKRLRRPQSFASAYESGDRKIDVLEFLRIARATNADPCEILRRVM
jgi:Helix-turn-helix